MTAGLRKHYVLTVLTLTCTLNYLDRGLVALLAQPIKAELHLTDSQLGFLTGIVFGLFYATLGIPMARWADRGDRVSITSLAIGLWGLTVMAAVLVRNFGQLLAARVTAAVGEAGCLPPTYSLVGDYFPGAAERTRAMSLYWLASPLAALISFAAGGWLNEQYGWRQTFFLMGIPGLALAVIVRLTITDPRSRAAAGSAPQPLPAFSAVLQILWGKRSTRHLTVAIVLLATLSLGLGPWYAAFMIRSHGMGTRELGLWLGVIFGIGGTAGTWLGGYIAARWFPANERRQMQLSAAMTVLLTPLYIAFLLVSGEMAALLLLGVLMLVFCFFVGPSYSLLQRLVPHDMRATTLAVVMLLANLIGMGIGPQLVGWISDGLLPSLGGESLRYAMLVLSVVALWAGYHFWATSRSVTRDLAAS
jgi:MFS family permease